MAGTQKPEDNNQTASTDSLDGIREVMQFDPFKPGANFGSEAGGGQDTQAGGQEGQDTAAGGEQQAKPEGQAGTPQGQPGSAPPAGEPEGGKKPAAQGDGQPTPDISALQETIRRMLGGQPATPQGQPQGQPQAAPQAQPQPGQPAQAQPGQPQQTPEQPAYQFRVSRELVDALGSDEPEQREAAVSALANSMMNRIATDFKAALVQLESRIMATVPQQVQQTSDVRATQQQIEQDFYSAFPTLNNPMLKDTVWRLVYQLGQAEGLTSWNEDFRNRAGEAVHAVLGIPKAAIQPQQTQQGDQGTGAPAQQPRKASFASGGATGRANGSNLPNEFQSVLNAGQ